MNTKKFTGVITALITPMSGGNVNYDELEKLVEHQISEGINGLVAVGTTGESPTLNMDEHISVIRKIIEVTNQRVPVIAGTGSNSTVEAVELSKSAIDAGVDGLLLVSPYYNKPSQEGQYRHFSKVAEISDTPIVLYSIPGRCVVDISTDTVVRLITNFPHVNTIKEAGGDCDRVSELLAACGDSLTVLSGDDSLTLPFMSVGAKGVISVASNLVIKDLVEMVSAALKNNFDSATYLHHKYFKLFKNIFVEPNPVPIKFAMKQRGLIQSDEVRLPLCEMSDFNKNFILQTMKGAGLEI